MTGDDKAALLAALLVERYGPPLSTGLGTTPVERGGTCCGCLGKCAGAIPKPSSRRKHSKKTAPKE